MSYDINDYDSSPKVEAWPKLEIGQSLAGRIDYVATRPYVKHDPPQFNPRNQSKATLKIVVGGKAIYPRTHLGPEGRQVYRLSDGMDPVPDRMMSAIAGAVKAVGRSAIEEGGYLKLTRIDDAPTQRGMAHNYVAEYVAPPPGANVDAFQTTIGTPQHQPQQQPVQQGWPQQPAAPQPPVQPSQQPQQGWPQQPQPMQQPTQQWPPQQPYTPPPAAPAQPPQQEAPQQPTQVNPFA